MPTATTRVFYIIEFRDPPAAAWDFAGYSLHVPRLGTVNYVTAFADSDSAAIELADARGQHPGREFRVTAGQFRPFAASAPGG